MLNVCILNISYFYEWFFMLELKENFSQISQTEILVGKDVESQY